MSRVVGVLLAGGRGTRFEGGNKLLAEFEGQALVGHAARSLANADLERAVAVLGHDADAVEPALDGIVDETVYNPEYERGQSRSVRAGAEVARARGADAALFLPGDMPCVDAETVDALVAAYEDGGGDGGGEEDGRDEEEDASGRGDGSDEADEAILVPTVDGRRGNPVLFGAARFADLAALSGDVGGRALFEGEAVRSVPVDDPGVRCDVDTKAALSELRQFGCDGRS